MKIACIMLGSWKKTLGGREVFTYNLLERLKKRGHNVVLYVAFESYLVNRNLYRRMDFRVKPLFVFTFVLGKAAPNILRRYLKRQQRENKFDIWQIVGAYPGAWFATSLAGDAPLVLRTHGEDIQKDKTLNYGKRLNPEIEDRIKYTLNKMDSLVALTKSVIDCYRKMGIDSEKITEIPNGIDLDRFKASQDKQKIRKQWNLASNKIIILTVGRYHAKKNYEIILDVAYLLKEHGMNFLWLIAGSKTESLSTLIQQRGLQDYISIQGEVGVDFSNNDENIKMPSDKLISLYACADVFVFPSRLETFGRVLIEAMATGIPVVSTDAPGCRDVIEDQHNGLLVGPDDSRAFVSAICRIMHDEPFRNKLIDGGYNCVNSYDWEVVTNQYEQLYNALKRKGN